MKEQIAELRRQAKVNRDLAEASLKAGDVTAFNGAMQVAEDLNAQALSIESAATRLSAFNGSMDLPDNAQMIQLSTPGNPINGAVMTPAGHVDLGRRETKTGYDVWVDGEHGEGIFTAKQLNAVRSPEYKNAFNHYLRVGRDGLDEIEKKTLQEGIDTAGGFLVPDEIASRIIQKEPTPTRVADMVTTIQTSRDAIQFPKVTYTADDKYTTGIRVTWTGEIPASATAHRVTDPVFGMTRIPVYTSMMSLPLTLDQAEDSAFPMIQWVSDKFRETIRLLRDDMVENGSGVGQPFGILTQAARAGVDDPSTVVSGNASDLTGDGLIDLTFALPEQYDQNARFVFNKTSTGKTIAKMKDGDGRYLWSMGEGDNGLAPGFLGRPLIGYPVSLSGFMPDVGSATYPIIFGDLRGYFLVDRVGLTIQVLREVYAETNIIVLLARIRFGGLVAEPFRLKVQKCST